MPIISQFFGIAIYMFWREHEPAHFHAKYGDYEITVEIETGVVNGKMTPRALALVQEWRKVHLEELKKEWELVKSKKPLFPIKLLEQDMILHVVDVKYVRDYIIWVRFNDGIDGEVDLSAELEGEVFGSLKDKDLFKTVKVDPLLQTIVWDNGADLAPEFLYDNLKISI